MVINGHHVHDMSQTFIYAHTIVSHISECLFSFLNRKSAA